MNLFPYRIYKATPETGGAELIAGFRERREAVNYLNYAKMLDRDGGRLYMKETGDTESREGS